MARDRYLSFNGVPVRFQVHHPIGAPKNRALLLPSPLLRAEYFERVAASLSESGCLCVCCDVPGFGKSAIGARRLSDPDAAAQMLWGILDEIDSGEDGRLSCWHLFAHGLAAQTAWDMARISPDSVASLALICPAFTAPGFLRHKTVYSVLCRISAMPTPSSRIARLLLGKSVSREECTTLRRAFLRPGVRENLEKMLKRDISPEPMGLFAPKLVLWSGQDSVLGRRIPPHLHQTLPDAEYHTLRTAGHVPMHTHARAVRDYLRGWLTVNGS